eukprot:TRINITY_DN66539_c0_g1_i1.p1 TRINITY_DN66539_c0_g1~~TRINITY_DN66539_c0_g1_i1.p1  ORF type:complete len:235 (-),score=46.12 TRINITY_DN66539_c0_g1_i1:86-790(-)
MGMAYGCMLLTPPVGDKGSENVREALDILDGIYGGRSLHCEKTISDDAALEQLKQASDVDRMGDIELFFNPVGYGELPPLAMCQLLHEVGAKAGLKIYDLGSGNGKLVLLSWLLGLEVVGIELIKERSDAARAALGRLTASLGDDRPSTQVSLIEGSFLNIDLSDADIVFTFSYLFTREIREGIAEITRKCRPGTCVISSSELRGSHLSSARDFYCQDFRKQCCPLLFRIQTVM